MVRPGELIELFQDFPVTGLYGSAPLPIDGKGASVTLLINTVVVSITAHRYRNDVKNFIKMRQRNHKQPT